jgi:pentapeptide MXKDX repeat protein
MSANRPTSSVDHMFRDRMFRDHMFRDRMFRDRMFRDCMFRDRKIIHRNTSSQERNARPMPGRAS